MRLFTLLDFHHFLLGLFLGLAAALVIYLAFRNSSPGKVSSGDEGGGSGEGQHQYPEGFRINNNPMPPVMIFLVLGFLVWLFFYVIIFGLSGGPL